MSRRRPKGEGSVYLDGEVWVARLPLPPGPGGKRRRVKRTATTEAGAKAKLAELIR